MKVHNWPKAPEPYQYYVRDRCGVIWFVDMQYDSAIATSVTSAGSLSVGFSVLRDMRGPLHDLKFVVNVLESFPTIDPVPKLTEPKQEIVAVTEAEARALS